MRKSDLLHSNLKVRSACRKLIHAVNENPSAFDGLEFNRAAVAKSSENKALREISLAGMMMIIISKFLGWH